MTPLDWFTAATTFEHSPLVQRLIILPLGVSIGYFIARYLLNRSTKGETR